MKRRNFLQAAAAISVPALIPITGIRGSASRFTSMIAPESDRILVIVHLFGGNDGINTVIPMDQYDGLNVVRKNFAIRETEPLKISDTVGLHPEMGGMKNMFSDGHLEVIQSVGYPKPNRSHFRSTDIWTSGSSSQVYEQTGWFGRYLDTVYSGFPVNYPNLDNPHPPAISMGDVSHATCEGPNLNFAQTVLDPLSVQQLNELTNIAISDDRFGEELEYIRTTMTQTNAYNSVIEEAALRGRNAVEYNDSQNALSEQLQKVARMISGGLKTKVYTVYISGFDTHARQVTSNTSGGGHAVLLGKVSNAISDFQRDLTAQGLDERVMGMTFSEFGRRIRPNASAGTDHGDAGPMFLFGSCVNGGIIGDNVEIHRDVSQTAGVPMQFDFRDIYGSILVDWFDVGNAMVKNLLYDGFKYMPLASSCNADVAGDDTIDTTPDTGWVIGEPSPDPSTSEVSINITSPAGGSLRYSLFDGRGRLVLVNEITVNGTGNHKLFSRPSRLPAGDYTLRLVTGSGGAATRNVTFN